MLSQPRNCCTSVKGGSRVFHAPSAYTGFASFVGAHFAVRPEKQESTCYGEPDAKVHGFPAASLADAKWRRRVAGLPSGCPYRGTEGLYQHRRSVHFSERKNQRSRPRAGQARTKPERVAAARVSGALTPTGANSQRRRGKGKPQTSGMGVLDT